jgi:hypothetical protein
MLTLDFVEHVVAQILHGLVLPDLCQALCAAVAHRILHLSVTAGIGFSGGIGV